MICVVGSINQDIVSYVSRLPEPGETLTGKGLRFFPGGKGANQAVAAARLGQRVRMVGCVGQDPFGDAMTTSLRANGVAVEAVERLSGVPTGTAVILVEEHGENRIVLEPGANAQVLPSLLEGARSVLAESGVLLLQLEIPLATVEAAALLGRELGLKVILDPAPIQSLSPSLLRAVDVLTPNQGELRLGTGANRTDDPESCAIAARHFLDQGVGAVVVKMGRQGCVLVEKNGAVHLPPYNVEAVDTTGAGDAFNGGLAAAVAEGRSLLEACRFANAVGALTVTGRGAQSSMPTGEDLRAFLTTQAELPVRRLGGGAR